jgi:prepilin-type N-terminal cleavage/methylation domain-containing protein/prepilin-type processing-associated H-X9-DG protein
MRCTKRTRSGFTLIELLVVIAIIAILAAILFPVFAQAREKARTISCVSNSKQLGTAIGMYVQDYDETYPQCYYYKNNTATTNGSSSGGYVTWTVNINPYIKNAQLFVCPSDVNKGLPPDNAPCNPYTDSSTPGCEAQVPRLSYMPNSAIMPRKRGPQDAPNVVPIAAVDAPAGVIAVAEMTNHLNCIFLGSSGQGNTERRNKSHRPVNALMRTANGGQWAGQSVADATGNIYAITKFHAEGPEGWGGPADSGAITNVAGCRGTASDVGLHIRFMEPSRHNGGSNYTFADGHSKYYKFDQTINPNNFLWGRTYFPTGQPVLDQNGVQVR